MTVLSNALLDGQYVDITLGNRLIEKIVQHRSSTPQQGVDFVDAKGLAVFPGLINMHAHSTMTLFRGLGDDQPLDRWLNEYIWPAEKKLTDETIYQGTLQACREMLASGTTAFNDMYFRLPFMTKAVEECGINAMLGYTLFGDATDLDKNDVIDMLTSHTEYVHYSIDPHSVYTVTEEGLRRAAKACKELHLPMHIHMSETLKEVDDCKAKYGCRPWELLDKLGILDMLNENIIAAHCLHLSNNEIKLIGEHHVTAVHCPNSNLKLGSGYKFMMLELLEAGAKVALGTDGSASSNNLDMIEVMKISTLLQKGWRMDPTVMPAQQIMDIAACGHKVAKGMPNCLFLAPVTSLSNLVYATHGESVEMTIVNGKVAYVKDSFQRNC